MATFDDIWKFLEFGNWKSGNLESARNWLVLANFNILGIFPTQFRSLSLILNSEFQISNFSGIWKFGNLEILRNWLVFGQFQYIGYFSHSVRSQNLILNSEFQISHFSGFFPEIFWKSGNSPEFAFFDQFLCMGHHFHLISVAEIDFALRISNFKIFLDFFLEMFWKSGKFPEFGQFQTKLFMGRTNFMHTCIVSRNQ